MFFYGTSKEPHPLDVLYVIVPLSVKVYVVPVIDKKVNGDCMYNHGLA